MAGIFPDYQDLFANKGAARIDPDYNPAVEAFYYARVI